jgi:multicomponent Na+:H+ antiporter subunit E
MHWTFALRRTLHLLPVLLLLWYALAGGVGWVFGAIAACGVAVLGHWLVPGTPVALSPSGLARFAGYFLARSLLGGIDVAWRAFHPGMPLDTHEAFHELRFTTPQERTLFIGALSLLPGTLSCDVVDDRLRVHSIAGHPQAELQQLERRVRDVLRHGAPRAVDQEAA